jgi:hypothetical protein
MVAPQMGRKPNVIGAKDGRQLLHRVSSGNRGRGLLRLKVALKLTQVAPKLTQVAPKLT